MLKRFAQLAGLTLLLGMVFVPAAHASPQVSFSLRVGPSVPIAPYAVAPGPPPGYVWQPGYYERTRVGPRWVRGAWVPAPYSRGNWARERWEREHRDYHRNWDWRRDRGDWDWRREGDRRGGDRDERGNWRR